MKKFENDCLKFLLKMVSTKSLSKNEKAVSQVVAIEMRKLKYDDVKIDKLGSVIGKIGTGDKKILFDAHIDTVGIADVKQWKTDPFKAVYKNGIIYGRGSCDDKGCVASMVYAGALLKQTALKCRLQKDFTLYVSASVQEEIAEGYGIDLLLKSLKFRPDCVVIGEPSGLKIVRGHKGRAEIKITTKGKSCHASIPDEGENAIYKMLPLIKNIDSLNKKYKITSQLGKPVISVTQIETKNASINTIPDNCSIYIDRRTVENETKQEITDELKNACGKNVKIDYLKKFFNAWVLPREHYLVKSAVSSYKKAYKKNTEALLWPFCTNGSFTMGERKIPTIGFGPGEEKFAHVANEQLRFNDVLIAIKFYSIFPLTFSEKKI
ncbi:MAG: YgeY family selenium metabolism-linked hydrolase [Elusimicrobiota bacterium]|nr:YgeY family selenium metabolism-linked hydrolase [Elusimicrobiota bacterium]